MHKMIHIGKIKTSKTELVDITKAWLALSLAFAFVYSETNLKSLLGGSVSKIFSIQFALLSVSKIFSIQFALLFIVSLFTAGLGFLLHELAHKFVAQKYGCAAEFRAWDQFLYLAVGLAFFVGFIFAAPGAVMISGMVTRKENGLISVAGPLMNYVMGMIFLVLMLSVPLTINAGGRLIGVWSIGFFINLWLGLFNLIPFGPLDGLKVFHWNKVVWSGMVLFGIYFLFFL